jgi:hypothetical protein
MENKDKCIWNAKQGTMPGLHKCLMLRRKEIKKYQPTSAELKDKNGWLVCNIRTSGLTQKIAFSAFWVHANLKIDLPMMKNVKRLIAQMVEGSLSVMKDLGSNLFADIFSFCY